MLFAITAATGILWIPHHQLTLQTALLVVSFPALASLAFVASSSLTQLVVSDRVSFPLNLTLPFVHVVLLFAIARLAFTTPSVVQSVRPEFEIVGIWGTWNLLAVCFLFQVAALSAMALWARRTVVGQAQ